ncbi:MAG: hypothetical protein H6772_02570 [Pseudomonadales bacterium]|nr:hypothetical protein [Pseudomonadales bacterium]
MKRLETFTYKHKTLITKFIVSSEVFPGVVCDVYLHPETKERDLGVIYIESGKKTKPQKVLTGQETIEGYISGKGRLIILKPNGEKLVFEVSPETEGFSHTIEVGDIMQWQSDENLVVFEICYPPYQDGRFENLEDVTLNL